ncbi:MAG: HVO_0476 family zinc finger protein [Halobacteriaceae archaeon]
MSDADVPDRISLACPGCTPDGETTHEVLTTGGGYATLRCTDCQQVHKERLPGTERVERDVVISQDGESVTATMEARADETLERGDEFVVESDTAILEVRITDLQLGAEQRTKRAPVDEIETIWTRAIDNVSVRTTINPDDGREAESRSTKLHVPGTHEFTVGEVEEHGDTAFEVTGIRLRDDAEGYEFKSLDHDGDTALAKDVARLYGRDTTEQAWSAWG